MKNQNRVWTEIDGWFTKGDALLYEFFVDGMDCGDILEIGVWKGRSTVCLADYITRSQKDIRIHMIDTFRGDGVHVAPEDTLSEFLRNIIPYSRLIGSIRVGMSSDLAVWNKMKYDVVYIDASHDYESVKRDILDWTPFVKTGGYISGHDYSKKFPGVVKAVNEAFGDKIQRQGVSWYLKIQE